MASSVENMCTKLCKETRLIVIDLPLTNMCWGDDKYALMPAQLYKYIYKVGDYLNWTIIIDNTTITWFQQKIYSDSFSFQWKKIF